MNEQGKQRWIPDKEDRSVVKDPVPVSLLCVELYGEPTWITSGVCRAFFSADSGEAHHKVGLLADVAEYFGGALKTVSMMPPLLVLEDSLCL